MKISDERLSNDTGNASDEYYLINNIVSGDVKSSAMQYPNQPDKTDGNDKNGTIRIPEEGKKSIPPTSTRASSTTTKRSLKKPLCCLSNATKSMYISKVQRVATRLATAIFDM